MLTPQQATEKHNRNLKNATIDIEQGIKGVTVSPTQEAAKKQDKMIRNLTAAVQDGSWKRGLERVTLEEWKDKAVNVGVPRISAGIDAAKADVEDFFSQFLPVVANVRSQVKAMPDLTLQDNLNRMVKNATELSKFRRK